MFTTMKKIILPVVNTRIVGKYYSKTTYEVRFNYQGVELCCVYQTIQLGKTSFKAYTLN